MKTNHEINSPRVRVVDENGEQVGILSLEDALKLAKSRKLDLVEIVPQANPPVCKVINYGKYRYTQTKKEKENKKAHHQIKVKEVKLRLNIDTHDLEVKMNRALSFLGKGDKVKVSLMFRGREMAHQENGRVLMQKVIDFIGEEGQVEAQPKLMGRFMTMVFSPSSRKK